MSSCVFDDGISREKDGVVCVGVWVCLCVIPTGSAGFGWFSPTAIRPPGVNTRLGDVVIFLPLLVERLCLNGVTYMYMYMLYMYMYNSSHSL